MSDPRRSRRPDSRQMWDESDRRDRNPPRDRERGWDSRDKERDRGRDRGRDRRGYRSRSRDRRDKQQDRSMSPDKHRRERGGDRNRGGWDRRGGRHGDRRESPRRQDDKGDRDGNDRDRRSKYHDDHRRSPSPSHSALPTRPHPESTSRKPQPSIKIKTELRSPSPSRRDDERGRDRSPRRGDRSPSHDKMDHDANTRQDDDDDDIVIEGQDDLAAMQALMGFGGFDTTKGKKIPGNDVGAVRKEKKSEYRQYMNRQGGFNRPLSPSR
ncbi:uncharacterized protein TRIREDRAFT_106309 [Trichoderma reesei QM6a]|uniref:Predicted protein n=2 Tax=Hypocrea jecorina TaxID=51453 RepID=G0RHQ9_HYPJQ|nr:uncharacterized protein TRIREDRAFT_106309 [Trichoderma reesei QM6a]EGR49525.1 predicted protein [Trichoderma reesei QM6a]